MKVVLSALEQDAVECLSTRARWCIQNQLDIDVEDEPRRAAEAIAKLSRWELLRWPNFGQKSLKEVALFLSYFEEALSVPPPDTRPERERGMTWAMAEIDRLRRELTGARNAHRTPHTRKRISLGPRQRKRANGRPGAS